MKKTLTLLTLCAAATFLGAANASAQLKVGIVDMTKVFAGYSKTKEAETHLNETRNQFKTERDSRLEKLKALMEEVNKLDADTKKAELSADKKEAAVKLRDEKINEVRTMDREIAEFSQQRDRQFQEQTMRMRGDILQDIRKVVNDRSKADGYDLVLDSSVQATGVPTVLLSAPSMDFTDSVITELNKNAPKKSGQ